MQRWAVALVLAMALSACGEMGWRKNGGGTVSQFNDDTYACNLLASRAVSAGVSVVPAPSSDARSACTSRGEGLTACAPVAAGQTPAAASTADANAALLEKSWRECMLDRGWREVKAAEGAGSAAK